MLSAILAVRLIGADSGELQVVELDTSCVSNKAAGHPSSDRDDLTQVGVLRVLQSKEETKAFDNKISNDLSDEMIRLAQRLVETKGLTDRVELCCEDVERLPHAAESMDAAFMSFTLKLLDTPAIPNVLGECSRVLRPGGRVVVAGMSKRWTEWAGRKGLRV